MPIPTLISTRIISRLMLSTYKVRIKIRELLMTLTDIDIIIVI